MGRLEESIQAYDRSLEVRPVAPASLYGRGIARIRKGDHEAGERDLAAALKISPQVAAEFTRMGVSP